jgi:hypothetical protein
LVEGYALSTRDFNPNNVVLESGLVNKTRWFCSQHLVNRLRLAVGDPERDLVAEAVLVPPQSQAESNQTPARSLASASPAVLNAVAAAREFDPALGAHGQDSPTTRAWAGCVAEVANICSRVHNPQCRFWDYPRWGAFPIAAAYVGDSRGLSTPEGRQAAIASVNQEVTDYIRRRAQLAQRAR